MSWLVQTRMTSCSEIGGATAFRISVNVEYPTLRRLLPGTSHYMPVLMQIYVSPTKPLQLVSVQILGNIAHGLLSQFRGILLIR